MSSPTPSTHSPVVTFIRSETFPKIVLGVGIALGVVIVFEAGVFVGRHEGMFSSRWGQNYTRNFGGPQNAMGEFDEHGPMANGTFGKIVEVASSSILIADQKAPEQRIEIDADTLVRDRMNTVGIQGLAVGESVVVIGEPNSSGQIDAKLIRIVPSADMVASSSTATPY